MKKDESNSPQATGVKKELEAQSKEAIKSIESSETKKGGNQTPPPPELKKILIGKLLEPIHPILIRWTQRLSWKKALALFVLLTSVAGVVNWVWQNPTKASDYFRLFAYYWDARHQQTFHHGTKQAETTSLLSDYVADEFSVSRRGSADGRHDSWTEAQIRISLNGTPSIDDADLLKWFQEQTFGRSCWRQHPNGDVDHIGATGWILLAFSRMEKMQKRLRLNAFLLISIRQDGGPNIHRKMLRRMRPHMLQRCLFGRYMNCPNGT